MQNLLKDLEALLQRDQSFISDGAILKNAVVEAALNMDTRLLELLMQSETIKEHFFTEVAGALVFDKVKFQDFVSNKAFLPDSYTAFKNRIGLTDGRGDYLNQSRDVVLAWPYKDCVLEGGMTKEDQGCNEVFWNTTLAPDDITRLFEPKVMTGWERWDAEAVVAGKPKSVGEVSEDDNLLIKGNNLLVLHSLKENYAGKIDCIYIDPPYNPPSKSNTFLYNNRFNHSSWLTFMKNRLEVARQLLKHDGSLIVAIDENEFFYLGVLLKEVFPNHEVHCISVVHNPRGVQGANFSYINEYALFVIPKAKKSIGGRVIDDEEVDWSNFRNWGTESERSDAKNCFYSVKVKDGEVIGFGEVLPDNEHPEQTVEGEDGVFEVFPIDTKGDERKWRYARQSADEIKNLLRAVWRKGHYEIELGKNFGMMRTVWQDRRYDANGYGSQLLREIVPGCDFTFPKSLWTVHDCIKAVVGEKKTAKVLDFFAGSGTTGHAVLELNKSDNGRRTFIMTEQLDYVETCTKQRIVEVIKRDRLNARFVYAEAMHSNAAFVDRIGAASDMTTLQAIHADIQATGYLRYDVDLSGFDTDDFAALPLADAKRVLMDCLDANHLYVDLGSLGDADFDISDEDARATRSFYGVGK
ncbi:site-specific DNA-methyltransferase [Vreelandella gomseomensis]|uniref:site-specific DNA-methyltransferase (adenine-specific) n=1 Tax=Vreelandella gomseomensis TaxID=370766 RepID=A0ABU1GCA9_9GAMM|nr:site-specific DNA-methyltransferase [Halomonas gomseomensis]MDR5875125.1 site-specific DNA-methyltransferase [Halomonas gomseomensis]